MINKYEINDSSDYFYCDCMLCKLEEIRNKILLHQLMIYLPFCFWDKLNILSEKVFRKLVFRNAYI